MKIHGLARRWRHLERELRYHGRERLSIGPRSLIFLASRGRDGCSCNNRGTMGILDFIVVTGVMVTHAPSLVRLAPSDNSIGISRGASRTGRTSVLLSQGDATPETATATSGTTGAMGQIHKVAVPARERWGGRAPGYCSAIIVDYKERTVRERIVGDGSCH